MNHITAKHGQQTSVLFLSWFGTINQQKIEIKGIVKDNVKEQSFKMGKKKV